MNNKKLGFTLAEVLITLGIIGVVAALTMPMLMQKYNNSVAETRLKKFYTTMNQAVLMAKNDYGDFPWDDYHVLEQKDEHNNLVKDENGMPIDQNSQIDIVFNKYWAPYLKISRTKTVKDAEGSNRVVRYFADGSAFAFRATHDRDLEFFPSHAEKCLEFKFDDRSGSCSFMFLFVPHLQPKPENDWKYHYNKGVEPYLYAWDGQTSSLQKGCNNEIEDYRNGYCTALISQNGWKVPKDYPKKIKF